MAKAKKRAALVLGPQQKEVIGGYWLLYARAVQHYQRVPRLIQWAFRGRRRECERAAGVLNDMVILIAGPGASLDMRSGEPVITSAVK